MTKKIFTIATTILSIAIGSFIIYNIGFSEETDLYFPSTSILPERGASPEETEEVLSPIQGGLASSNKKTEDGENNNTFLQPQESPENQAQSNKDKPKGKEKQEPKDKDVTTELDKCPSEPKKKGTDLNTTHEEDKTKGETAPKQHEDPIRTNPQTNPIPYEHGKKRFLNFFLPKGHINGSEKEQKLMSEEPNSYFFKVVGKYIETGKYINVVENICSGIHTFFHKLEGDDKRTNTLKKGSGIERDSKKLGGDIWKYCAYVEDNKIPSFGPYYKDAGVPYVDYQGEQLPGKEKVSFGKEIDIMVENYHIGFRERFKGRKVPL